MNTSLIEISNRIKSTSGSERAKHVSALIAKADALGDALTMEDVDAIRASLSPIGELKSTMAAMDDERNPERIRTLMAEAMKLRNQMKVAAK